MIVLYMLKRSDTPLSKSQIYDFMLNNEYTNFLTLQEVFSELSEAGLVDEKTVANRTYLEITEDGVQTLGFFVGRINPAIRSQIDDYIRENGIELRNESSILGDFLMTGENEYTVHLRARENGQDLIDLKIPVPTESMAENMVRNWHEKNQEIYQYLFSQLMSE
jgi:predicted transcriptional regulator